MSWVKMHRNWTLNLNNLVRYKVKVLYIALSTNFNLFTCKEIYINDLRIQFNLKLFESWKGGLLLFLAFFIFLTINYLETLTYRMHFRHLKVDESDIKFFIYKYRKFLSFFFCKIRKIKNYINLWVFNNIYLLEKMFSNLNFVHFCSFLLHYFWCLLFVNILLNIFVLKKLELKCYASLKFAFTVWFN